MSLKETIAALNKKMGAGTIVSASMAPEIYKMPSSLPAINYLSYGGIPVNRIIEFVGPFSSLKSWTAYDYIGRFQRMDWSNKVMDAFTSFEYTGKGAEIEIKSAKTRRGYKPSNTPIAKRVALIDIEGTYTPSWGKKFGIDNAGLIRVQPDRLSQAVDVACALLAEEDVSLVVLDSMSIIGADDEIDSSMESHQMGSGARFWNKAMRKMQSAMNSNPNKVVTLIMINSVYSKVGFVMGDPTTIKNGDQLKLSKSLSIMFKKLKEITGEHEGVKDVLLGVNISVKCLKNKVGQLGRTSNFFYSYVETPTTNANTPDIYNQLIDLAVKYEIIVRKGAWYNYKDVKVSGMENFIMKLVEEGLFAELSADVSYMTNKY